MFAWIAENFTTIAVCLVLAAVAAVIIARMIGSKKKGKPSCCCGCSGCPESLGCRHKR